MQIGSRVLEDIKKTSIVLFFLYKNTTMNGGRPAALSWNNPWKRKHKQQERWWLCNITECDLSNSPLSYNNSNDNNCKFAAAAALKTSISDIQN